MEGQRTILSQEVGRTLHLQRDGSDRAGLHTVVETFHDMGVTMENARIRQAGLVSKGKRVGLHENEEIKYFFRIPSPAHYADFQRKYPDIIELIQSLDESDRMLGAQKMALIEPTWLISE